MDKKDKTEKRKTHKRRSMKGGSGILTYGLNLYNPDTQLQNNYYTTRQMYSDQSIMNPRVLGGGKRGKTEKKKGGKRGKTEKKKGGKKGKKGSRKENCPWK
jgi:hypothetical protein